jgi:hypothetical protein
MIRDPLVKRIPPSAGKMAKARGRECQLLSRSVRERVETEDGRRWIVDAMIFVM